MTARVCPTCRATFDAKGPLCFYCGNRVESSAPPKKKASKQVKRRAG